MGNLINMFPTGGGGVNPNKYTTIINVSATVGVLTGTNITVNGTVFPLAGANDSVSISSPIGTVLEIVFDEKAGYLKPANISYTVIKDTVIKLLSVQYIYDVAYVDFGLSANPVANISSQIVTIKQGETTILSEAYGDVTPKKLTLKSSTTYKITVSTLANYNETSPITVTTGFVNSAVASSFIYQQFKLPTYTGSYTITEIVPNKKGYITLKSSGTLFIPFDLPVDVFAVGAGGVGSWRYTSTNVPTDPPYVKGALGGGGGGYCVNLFNVIDLHRTNVNVQIASSYGITRIDCNGVNKVTARSGSPGKGGQEIGDTGYGGAGGTKGGNGYAKMNSEDGKDGTRAFNDNTFPFYGGAGGGCSGIPYHPLDIFSSGKGGKGGGSDGTVGTVMQVGGIANTGGGCGGVAGGGRADGGSGVAIVRWGY